MTQRVRQASRFVLFGLSVLGENLTARTFPGRPRSRCWYTCLPASPQAASWDASTVDDPHAKSTGCLHSLDLTILWTPWTHTSCQGELSAADQAGQAQGHASSARSARVRLRPACRGDLFGTREKDACRKGRGAVRPPLTGDPPVGSRDPCLCQPWGERLPQGAFSRTLWRSFRFVPAFRSSRGLDPKAVTLRGGSWAAAGHSAARFSIRAPWGTTDASRATRAVNEVGRTFCRAGTGTRRPGL